MKTLRKCGLVLGIAFLLSCFCGISVMNAKAEGETITVKTDFTTLTSLENVNGVVESTGVSVNADASHGAIPSGTWATPFLIADTSYIIYEIDAKVNGGNRILDTVAISINGRVWNQNDGTAHAENAVNVYTGIAKNNVSTLVHSYNPSNSNNSTNFAALGEALNLTEYFAAGYSKAYIKVELVQSKVSNGGTTADADGNIDIWFAGVKLSCVEITATTKEGAVIEYVNVKYYDGATLVNTVEYEKGSAIKAYIPAEKDGYDFDGWYLDQELTQRVSENYIVNEDVSIYGKWTATVSPETPKKGCGSHIEAAPVAIVLAAVAVAFIAIRRKQRRG